MARPRSDIRARILSAARVRFNRAGVDGTSLRAIAKDATTSIGMVHYYFGGKDELFLAVVEQTYEQLLADLGRALDPSVAVRMRLERLYERLALVSEDELDMLRLVVREALVSSARLERMIERFQRGHIPLILKTVRDGMCEGTLDARRNPVVLMMATLALAGPPQIVRRALGTQKPVSGAPAGKELARELVDVLLNGVAARETA